MKLFGTLFLIIAVALIGVAAFAQPNDTTDVRYQAVSTLPDTEVRKPTSAKRKLAPLKLPNITALTKAMWKADRSILPKQVTSSLNVIRFWEGKGRWIRAPRHEKCAEVPWQRSCTIARASLRLHTSLLDVAEKRLKYELPATNDWVTAVQIAQRAYPGTKWSLLTISDREGGWGAWVWYGGRHWSGYHVGDDFLGADTVGGWMQFRYSTFAPYWRQAQADLKRRGFLVPELGMPPEGGPTKYAGWLSPLGQALTAGYMFYYHKEGCHWCL